MECTVHISTKMVELASGHLWRGIVPDWVGERPAEMTVQDEARSAFHLDGVVDSHKGPVGLVHSLSLRLRGGPLTPPLCF